MLNDKSFQYSKKYLTTFSQILNNFKSQVMFNTYNTSVWIFLRPTQYTYNIKSFKYEKYNNAVYSHAIFSCFSTVFQATQQENLGSCVHSIFLGGGRVKKNLNEKFPFF